MLSLLSLEERIHSDALAASTRYKKAEADLIEILLAVEARHIFLKLGHPSLFSYVTVELGLSENTAYSLITVARKTREVPKLGEKIRAGEVTLSNARRVSSVLTPDNQEEWLTKACELSTRELEKEIVKAYPQEVVERTSYAAENLIRVEIGLSEHEMRQLRRVQDLMSRSKGRTVSLGETVAAMSENYLERHDPVAKAERNTEEPSVTVGELGTKRVPIPAAVKHQVNRRDRQRCTFVLPSGNRCNQSRWVEIHHIQPVSEGGPNTAENLTTLCSAHHKLAHQTVWRGSA